MVGAPVVEGAGWQAYIGDNQYIDQAQAEAVAQELDWLTEYSKAQSTGCYAVTKASYLPSPADHDWQSDVWQLRSGHYSSRDYLLSSKKAGTAQVLDQIPKTLELIRRVETLTGHAARTLIVHHVEPFGRFGRHQDNTDGAVMALNLRGDGWFAVQGFDRVRYRFRTGIGDAVLIDNSGFHAPHGVVAGKDGRMSVVIS